MNSSNKSVRPFVYGAISGMGMGLIVSNFMQQYTNLSVLGHLVGLALIPVGVSLMMKYGRKQQPENTPQS